MLVFKARPRRDPAQRPILTPSEKRVMQIMARARKEVIDDIKSREGDFLNSLLHQPAISTARMVITQPWFDVQEELQRELTTEVIDGGRRIKLEPIQKATVNFRFNAERPEAAAWAAKNAGQMIQNITEDQLNFVQELVRQSQLGEYTPDSAARTLRDMENGVGLTVQQSQWVQNFESRRVTDLMNQGLGYVDAVSRAQGATASYADRIYRYRTETIARTEILRASNEGRNQAWKQGLDEGFINPSQEKEWSTNLDDRTCEECAPLDGERVGVTDDFPWGDPPIHPNCRCTVLLTDDIPEDLANMTVDELDAEIDRLLSGEDAAATMTPDQRIAQLEAERDPIVSRLLEADYGRIQLTPEEYRALVDRQQPMWEELNALKQQKLEAQTRPTIRPSSVGTTTYDRISAGLDYDNNQRDAFQQWQGDGYRRVQGALYGETTIRGVNPELRQIIDGLDSAMTAVPRDTVLYRGQTQGLEGLQIGSTVKTGGYVSTSTDPITAGAFSKSAGQVTGGLKEGDTVTIMRIRPSGVRGAVVPNSSEFEVVLQRNAQMKVVGISLETIDGVDFNIVEMEA